MSFLKNISDNWLSGLEVTCHDQTYKSVGTETFLFESGVVYIANKNDLKKPIVSFSLQKVQSTWQSIILINAFAALACGGLCLTLAMWRGWKIWTCTTTSLCYKITLVVDAIALATAFHFWQRTRALNRYTIDRTCELVTCVRVLIEKKQISADCHSSVSSCKNLSRYS